jgi:phosphoglucomutase
MLPYVRDLKNVVDMDAIRDAKLKLAVDPLGEPHRTTGSLINALYGLDIVVSIRPLTPLSHS